MTYGVPTMAARKRLKFRTVNRDLHWCVQQRFYVQLIKSFTLAVMQYGMETTRILALQTRKRKKQCWNSKRYFSSFFRKQIIWWFFSVDSKSNDQTSSDSFYTAMFVVFFFSSDVFRLKVVYQVSWSEKSKVRLKLKSQRISMWISMVTKNSSGLSVKTRKYFICKLIDKDKYIVDII